MPKKKKRQLKKGVWLVIIIISLISVIMVSAKLIKSHMEARKTKDLVKEIIEQTPIEDVTVDEKEVILPPSVKENQTDDYIDYINMPFISVDFEKLLQKNSDTVAFINVPSTNINYPVVKTTDNDYYLNHSFDKSVNGNGWVFLDYRNDINNLGDNTIIYAHGGSNTTMFGTLKNVIKESWFKNKENDVIRISSLKENTLWKVFSVYKIKTETYYLTSNFGSKESHEKFIDTIVKRSLYDFHDEVSVDDKILTLSTCYNDYEKIVLHAKLIKKVAR